MYDYNKFGLTAKFMAMLAKVNPSTVSRYIYINKVKALEGASRRNCRYPIEETRKVLREFISSKKLISYNKKVHSFYNFKGGTGKTSISYQVSTHLALCGYKVLVIDSDPQSHLTITFGLIDNMNLPTLYDGIVNGIAPESLIHNVFDGLDLIPSNLTLSRLEAHLREKTNQENVIKRYLEKLKNEYDFIIFDANPSISTFNKNILSFSNVLNIVCETHPYSVHGMKVVMEDIMEFYKEMESSPPEIVIIPNKYEDRSSTSAEAMTALMKYYSDFLIPDFAVRKSEDFLKASRDGLPISFFCKVNSIAFEDVCDLVVTLIEKSIEKKPDFFEAA